MIDVASRTKVSTEYLIDSLFERHLSSSLANISDVKFDLSHPLSKYGYIKITDFIPQQVITLIRDETYSLLENLSKRRDILIPTTGHTPRYLSNVRQEDIEKYGEVIPSVYHSKRFMDFISLIAQTTIIPNPWKYEKFIINRLEKTGDTHGWHWGDYPYSIIWIVEAPSSDYGGMLQCIPHTYWNKEEPRVEDYILSNPIRSYHHSSGDVYLLKSDTTLHRVTPLEKPSTRVIINMAWEREIDKDREVSHETFAFRD